MLLEESRAPVSAPGEKMQAEEQVPGGMHPGNSHAPRELAAHCF